MNSLTPVSSLASTARDLVGDILAQTPQDDPRSIALTDAQDALETVARAVARGCCASVQNHRRLAKPLVTHLQVTPVQRVFARVKRLLSADLAKNDIQLTTSVEPPTLEVAADADLLDQALINLVIRNAIEALAGSRNRSN